MVSVFSSPPLPPPPASFNLAAHVLAHASAQPDKIALAVLGLGGAERWSYARLEAAVRGTATGLLRAGCAPGDRVLLRLGNSPDFPVAYLGAIAAGLVAVPTAAGLTQREITGMAARVEPKLCLVEPGLSLPEDPPLCVTVNELRRFHDLPPAAYDLGSPERMAYILFTSGTGGSPRAVAHAHRAIWARQMMHDGWYGLGPSDRMLHAGAFNWSYTLGTGLMDPWSVGATALIPSEGVDRAALALLIRRHDVSIFAGAPGVYRQLLRHIQTPFPKLRHGLSAGEKLPESLRSAWTEATGTPIHEAYGMTECSTFVSGAPSNPAPPGTLGRPQPGRHVALLDNGNPVAKGTPGRIAVSTSDPGLMLGYLGEAPLTGPWFVTGDIGEMTDDGAIRYLGRADDILTAGGYRVSPVEIEEVLTAHPDVLEAAAFDHALTPETRVIAAAIVGSADETTLKAHAETHLAPYKRPRLYLTRESLPRNANGKLLRRQLRET